MAAARVRWAVVVRRWRRSGQTAREFAARAGVNAGTLAYWAWRLKRETGRAGGSEVKHPRRRARAMGHDAGFVELIVDRQEDARFLLELSDGWRLRIPTVFDADALTRLLRTLREAP